MAAPRGSAAEPRPLLAAELSGGERSLGARLTTITPCPRGCCPWSGCRDSSGPSTWLPWVANTSLHPDSSFSGSSRPSAKHYVGPPWEGAGQGIGDTGARDPLRHSSPVRSCPVLTGGPQTRRRGSTAPAAPRPGPAARASVHLLFQARCKRAKEKGPSPRPARLLPDAPPTRPPSAPRHPSQTHRLRPAMAKPPEHTPARPALSGPVRPPIPERAFDTSHQTHSLKVRTEGKSPSDCHRAKTAHRSGRDVPTTNHRLSGCHALSASCRLAFTTQHLSVITANRSHGSRCYAHCFPS